MSIGKRSQWGHHGELPDPVVFAHDDHGLSTLLTATLLTATLLTTTLLTPSLTAAGWQQSTAPAPAPIVVTGGSLWLALGGETVVGRWRTPEAIHYPIDVIRVADETGRVWCCVNAVVLRNALWTAATVVLNGPFLGTRQLGPRAHPGDGSLDVLEAELALREVAKVAKRARSGTHLPHPGISVYRARGGEIVARRGQRLWLDGRRISPRVPRGSRIRYSVIPNAATVVI